MIHLSAERAVSLSLLREAAVHLRRLSLVIVELEHAGEVIHLVLLDLVWDAALLWGVGVSVLDECSEWQGSKAGSHLTTSELERLRLASVGAGACAEGRSRCNAVGDYGWLTVEREESYDAGDCEHTDEGEGRSVACHVTLDWSIFVFECPM